MGRTLEIKHTIVFEKNWQAYNDPNVRYIINQRCIVDWKSSSEFNVINSGVYSTKQFSDEYKNLNKLGNVSSDDLSRIYLNNKRSYETVKIA